MTKNWLNTRSAGSTKVEIPVHAVGDFAGLGGHAPSSELLARFTVQPPVPPVDPIPKPIAWPPASPGNPSRDRVCHEAPVRHYRHSVPQSGIGLRAADPEPAGLPHLIGDQGRDALLLGVVGGEGDEFLFGVLSKLEHDVLQVQVAEDGMA